LVAKNLIGDKLAAGRESGVTGKASHRGHRGGLWLVAKKFARCETPTFYPALTANAKVFTYGTFV
jgi:hypothetical protein